MPNGAASESAQITGFDYQTEKVGLPHEKRPNGLLPGAGVEELAGN